MGSRKTAGNLSSVGSKTQETVMTDRRADTGTKLSPTDVAARLKELLGQVLN